MIGVKSHNADSKNKDIIGQKCVVLNLTFTHKNVHSHLVLPIEDEWYLFSRHPKI